MKVGDKVVRDDGHTGTVVATTVVDLVIKIGDRLVIADRESGDQRGIGFSYTWKLAPRTVKCRFVAYDDNPDDVILVQGDEYDFDASRPHIHGLHWVGNTFEIEVPAGKIVTVEPETKTVTTLWASRDGAGIDLWDSKPQDGACDAYVFSFPDEEWCSQWFPPINPGECKKIRLTIEEVSE